MDIIIVIFLICWLSDNGNTKTGSTATTIGRTRSRFTLNQADLDRQRRQREVEQTRLVVQRQQEYWARHQREINQHNALVQHMTPGTSTASRTYWN